MAIFVEGVRGSGKSKIAVREIQTYLQSGRRVATNLDIKQELLAPKSKSYIVRLPDYPRSIDFELLGKAYPELDPDNPDTYDESKFGLVVVDELLTSFNSRSWSDKDRLACVSWMVQSRKLGWRLWLLAQDVDAVDKQLRETLLQEIWHCRSGKNFFSSPIAGKLFGFITGPLMKLIAPMGFHILTIYTGKRKDKVHLAGREFYKLYNLHPCYKTSQQFLPDNLITSDGRVVDMRASYTALPADYFPGKNLSSSVPRITEPTSKPKLPAWLDWKIPVFLSMVFGYFHFTADNQPEQQTIAQDPLPSVSQSSTNLDSSIEQDQPTETDFDKQMSNVFITCSVRYGTAYADFCFEQDGQTFYPENLGYQISYMSPCSAVIAFNGQSKLVTCRPTYTASETIKDNSLFQTTVENQNNT